jgi:hypothetical protein
MESHLHFNVALFDVGEENSPALAAATPDPLNEATAFDYGLIVPLDLEHPPVLLDVYCRVPLLLTVLLGLTIFLNSFDMHRDVNT